MTRTLAKTISYAIMHMIVVILVSYALSGSWKAALAIGMVEPCAQIFSFFIHENIWNKINKTLDEKPAHNHSPGSTCPSCGVAKSLHQYLSCKLKIVTESLFNK